MDLSTGQFQAADVPREKLADELGRLAPAEVLYSDAPGRRPKPAPLLAGLRESLPNLSVTPRPDWTFDPDSARAALMHHFGVTTLAGFGFDDHQPCVAAAGALLLYLRETLKADLGHLTKLRPRAGDRFLFLDEVTRRSLELTRTLRDGGRAGSLLAVMDRTTTPMGARLLQEWIVAPLADHAAIDARLDAVAELKEEHALRQELRGRPERGVRSATADGPRQHRPGVAARPGRRRPHPGPVAEASRPRSRPAAPPCCASWNRGWNCAPTCARRSNRRWWTRRRSAPRRAASSAAATTRPGRTARDHHERQGLDRPASRPTEITRTGINSLKVGYNQVHGYYIEITHTHGDRIPTITSADRR